LRGFITARIICIRRRAFSAIRRVPDRVKSTKLTGRFQKTATTKRKTIDEYKIAGWSSLGSGATGCKGGAIGGRVLIISGGEDRDRDKVVQITTSKPAGLMKDSGWERSADSSCSEAESDSSGPLLCSRPDLVSNQMGVAAGAQVVY